MKWIAIAAGAVLVVMAVYFVVTYRQERSAVVAKVGWELKINVEQFKTVRQDSWDLPWDARNVTSTREVHHTYTYVSGHTQSCSLTGRKVSTCTTVPIYSTGYAYADKYHYDVDRWTFDRVLQTHGEGHSFYWPDVSDLREPKTLGPQLGDERVGMRSSRFYIDFASRDNSYSLDMVESMWRGFEVGRRAHLELNLFGTIMTASPE